MYFRFISRTLVLCCLFTSFPSSQIFGAEIKGLTSESPSSTELVVDRTTLGILKSKYTSVEIYPAYLDGLEWENTNPEASFSGKVITAIVVKDGDGYTKLPIPAYEFERLSKQLSQGLAKVTKIPKDSLDCAKYGHYLKGARMQYVCCPGSPLRLMSNFWTVYVDVVEEDIRPGDLVLIERRGTDAFHYALYLGLGVWVSKFSAGGGVVFSDRKAMEKFFGHGDERGFSLQKLNVKSQVKIEPYEPETIEISRQKYFEYWRKIYIKPREAWDDRKVYSHFSEEFGKAMEEYLDSL